MVVSANPTRYGQELVQYIAKELDPTATCEAVHVCQLDTALTAVKKNPVLRVGNSTECTICTEWVSDLDAFACQSFLYVD